MTIAALVLALLAAPNADAEVSNDALREFANVDYKDVRDLYAKLSADTIAAWLKDENTPAFRYGLYASMLGHCGKPEHADLLKSMLDDPPAIFLVWNQASRAVHRRFEILTRPGHDIRETLTQWRLARNGTGRSN